MSSEEQTKKKFINEKELSKRWDIKVKSLQRWRWKGDGPPFLKFGHSIRYSISDIESYEKRFRFFSTSESQAGPNFASDADEEASQ